MAMNGWWGKSNSRASTEVASLKRSASLGQFLSHIVPPSSSKTLVQPPFESVWKHSLFTWTCWLKWGACCNQWVLTKLHGTISVFWVHGLTSTHSTRDGVPASAQICHLHVWEPWQRPKTGPGRSTSKMEARDMGASAGSNCPGQPQCIMFFCSPLFPYPRDLAACAQGHLWYCTVQIWAVPNIWTTWYRAWQKASLQDLWITPDISRHGVCWDPASKNSPAPARWLSQSLESKHKSSQTQHRMGNSTASEDS